MGRRAAYLIIYLDCTERGVQPMVTKLDGPVVERSTSVGRAHVRQLAGLRWRLAARPSNNN
jgi:hypothetical protein